MKKTLIIATTLLSLGAFAQSSSNSSSDSSQRGQRRGPPPEALAACESLSSGAPC